MLRIIPAVLLLIVSLPCFSQRDTLYVDGPHIYTASGEKVILRGYNEMFVWSNDKTGEIILPEMAKSGANGVRLVWSHQYGRKDQLVTLIENTIAHKMIAMPECHDATGKWGDDLKACIDFWNDPVLIEGIQDNRQWTMLNIANEAGDENISDEMFLDAYKPAIHSLRDWGYTVPIVIDASRWGQKLDQLIRVSKELLEHDPLKNVVFSAHSYWTEESSIANYQALVDAANEQSIAYVLGEGPSITRVGRCANPIPLPYREGMRILHEGEMGWLNWSWGGKKNSDCDDYEYFDFTLDGEFGKWLTVPGGEIVATHRYSVMQTSSRPESFYPDSVVSVSGIYINTSRDVLRVGETATIKVLIAPVNAANQAFELRHNDTTGVIAFDRERGRMTALSAGSVTFTAVSEDGNLEWQSTINVY